MTEIIFIIAEIVGLVCFVTGVLDMGMNGSASAGWAQIGIPIALFCFLIMASITP